MPQVKVRNVDAVGIISDILPQDVPPNGFDSGVNVRFADGKVSRANVFRTYHTYVPPEGSSTVSPVVHLANLQLASQGDNLFAVHANMKIEQVDGPVEIDVSPPFAPTSEILEVPVTSTVLGDVLYVNRQDQLPVYKSNVITDFTVLPAWNTQWRTRVLRAYKDFLIAFNVEKNGIEYPTLVKWSDVVLAGAPPTSWDETSTTNSAGETVLSEINGPILDALPLRNAMMIYSSDEVWQMDYVGGDFIFSFRRAFKGGGIINTNCVVDVQGTHFVFGENDIYTHDGNTMQSVADGRVKDFIFSALNKDLKQFCFAFYSARYQEVYFCYPSGDPLVQYGNKLPYCNRAAVFNIKTNTWSFIDMPNALAATLTTVSGSAGLSWNGASTEGLLWSTIGGSWYDLRDASDRHTVIASNAFTTDYGTGTFVNYGTSIEAFDRPSRGSQVTLPLSPKCQPLKSIVQSRYMPMDADGSNIGTVKQFRSLWPIARVSTDTGALKFSFGSTMTPNGGIQWDEVILDDKPFYEYDLPPDFSGYNDYKIDTRISGRYLSYKVEVENGEDFEFGGFDVDYISLGRR